MTLTQPDRIFSNDMQLAVFRVHRITIWYYGMIVAKHRNIKLCYAIGDVSRLNRDFVATIASKQALRLASLKLGMIRWAGVWHQSPSESAHQGHRER